MRNYQIMRYLLIVCWIIGNMPSGWAAGGWFRLYAKTGRSGSILLYPGELRLQG